MAPGLHQESLQKAQFVVLILFTSLSIILTALRFVAIRLGGRKASLEDWLAVAATVGLIFTNVGALEGPQNLLDYDRARNWNIVGLFSYFAHTLFVKYSVLALYYRIFGVRRSWALWIYFFVGFQAVAIIVPSFFVGFECTPFERYFDPAIHGTCIGNGPVIAVLEVPNAAIDFGMVALAMFMIRPLKFSSMMKWRLRGLFGLGVLWVFALPIRQALSLTTQPSFRRTGVIALVKASISYPVITDLSYSFQLISLLSAIHMFVNLLCCCLPVCKPILPTAMFWDGVSRRMAYHFSMLGRDPTTRAAAVHSAKRSSRSRGQGHPSKPSRNWEWLDDNSTRALAWPQATYHMETRVQSDPSSVTAQPGLMGIQVHKQIDIL
ncbi:hypothetical protein F4861DRAFT_154726 [Xylaria intraflava]|nr:hypothetical protein F4861DRAFT_154726 [Xylaria intraflava]